MSSNAPQLDIYWTTPDRQTDGQSDANSLQSNAFGMKLCSLKKALFLPPVTRVFCTFDRDCPQKRAYSWIKWTKFGDLGHFEKLRVHCILYIFLGIRNELEFEFYDQMQNSRIFSQNPKLIAESNYTLKML